MKTATHVRLSVFLLNSAHQLRAAAIVEGHPKAAARAASLKALKLLRDCPHVQGARLVIIPSGCGVMATVVARAISMSKAGVCLSLADLTGERLEGLGIKAAMMDWYGQVARRYVASSSAKDVQGVRLA